MEEYVIFITYERYLSNIKFGFKTVLKKRKTKKLEKSFDSYDFIYINSPRFRGVLRKFVP